ncbi:uncharacterized protein LOC126905895 [Daktulosphaira vitifoliae]|uniref:uncharacterized protein LOC126895275 n=1 Tax=Daktulosphaira vitifoliae TaxID=58002 RepID=UPI0021AA61E4|nr:uncharacterized protein LOC126895275 [Daktulosphaira vitifoliae]XP_050529702.1 uncharacterized protein LOC126899151 [Daktulosphaira vitifoliae]XP_050536785.1 uncharacterized protein LOC126902978 [Daktulosphaira vitifoliae]XP_050537066.1 uncharacterized protein LOC126903114 [Daktulosphaira vitifoliae]XP_050541975.1 uncharacterized protein LOC126905895 [Daktulosphaira vitifoliae]
MFTNSEYTDMILLVGETGNGYRASIRWAELYPNRRQPHYQTFDDVVRRSRETGILQPFGHRSGGNRSTLDVRTEETILEQVQNDPETSTRKIGAEININHMSVWKVLNSNKLYPFHRQKVQELLPRDFPLRLNFSREMLSRMTVDTSFLNKILFTDEASFTKDGTINLHNLHHWSEANPHVTRITGSQYKFSVNIWCGIVDNYLVGPFVLPDRLNGQAYLNFLRNNLPNLLEDVPNEIQETMWFMMDGAPPHHTNAVREQLFFMFPEGIIGRQAGNRAHYRPNIVWPPRSPDLTPCDFFLWGYLKEKVYCNEVSSKEELIARIFEACRSINGISDIYEKIRYSMKKRLQLCVQKQGGHIEQYLKTSNSELLL